MWETLQVWILPRLCRSRKSINVQPFLRFLLNMKLLVKLSLVTIFFLPPIAGWAGTQEEAKVVPISIPGGTLEES